MVERAMASALAIVVALAIGPTGCEPPKPPEAPEGAPEPPAGNCCMRNAAPTERPCGEQVGCCRGGLDRDECEEKNGLWFSTPEGCKGAC